MQGEATDCSKRTAASSFICLFRYARPANSLIQNLSNSVFSAGFASASAIFASTSSHCLLLKAFSASPMDLPSFLDTSRLPQASVAGSWAKQALAPSRPARPTTIANLFRLDTSEAPYKGAAGPGGPRLVSLMPASEASSKLDAAVGGKFLSTFRA